MRLLFFMILFQVMGSLQCCIYCHWIHLHVTLFFHSIPTSSSSSISYSVERFFSELYPSTYLSHVVVRRTNKIHSLLSEAKKLYKRVTQLRSDPSKQKRMNRGISGLFGRKDNVIEEYQKKLEDIEESVRLKQSEASLAGEVCGNLSVLSKLSALLDPKNIPGKLAVTVPAQASFFITYVVTQGWTSVSSELFRVIPFIFSWITRPFTSPDDDEFEVPSIPYHKDIPRVLFFGLLGITYFFLAPLILPFLLAYFCLAYIIYRNQFINVYAPKYDTAGKFWPVIHNSMIFSLVLMQIIAVGIFALKKLSMASTLTMPLPVLTLLFNEYCRKRFLPIFVAYSAESLIKKDRQDQNDATMTQFYENLVNAYKDPALLPLQYSPNNDNLRTPLIYQA
ncbi:hypothetical protein ACSQ67_025214 [Phaseolus vulgaris]